MKKVCITENWELVDGEMDTPNHPTENEIVTVLKTTVLNDIEYYQLEGYGEDHYNSIFFRDLDYDFVEEVLSNIREEELVI